MVTSKLIQVALLAVLGISMCLYFIRYFQQSYSPKVQANCQDVESWCQSAEVAAACGVSEFCRMQWHTIGADTNNTEVKPSAYPPVDVVVYFEALCPDSERFIKEQLYPSYEKLHGKDVFNLKLIPYGNAKETKKGDKWEFSCQHGEGECLGNMIQTCAIHILKNVTKWMPFVYCMEKNKATIPAAKKCSEEEQADFEAIENCRNGPVGNQLQHEMALETAALKPKHTFIPWITVNGKSEGLQTRALYNFLELICDLYTGKKPEVCKKF